MSRTCSRHSFSCRDLSPEVETEAPVPVHPSQAEVQLLPTYLRTLQITGNHRNRLLDRGWFLLMQWKLLSVSWWMILAGNRCNAQHGRSSVRAVPVRKIGAKRETCWVLA